MDLLARTLSAALLAGVLLALAATSAEANHSRGKCKQQGATLLKNDSGRVFQTERNGVTRLYGCLWSRNKAQLLETAAGDDFVTFEGYDDVLLRGRYVAWVFTREDISCKADCPPNYDSTTEYVNVYDLARGRGDVVTADPYLDSLRLNSGGAAAWLGAAAGGQLDVHAWDADGHRTLDTGPITHFRLRGPALSWVNGDVQHSVTLR